MKYGKLESVTKDNTARVRSERKAKVFVDIFQAKKIC